MEFTGNIPKVSSEIIRPKFHNGHWTFPEQMGIDRVGFIYVIRDTYLERLYLGKKQFFGTGVANRGHESNWRRYRSSSPVLKEMFKETPMDEFEFICIEQYKTKGTLSYSETWSLCQVEAPTSKLWYNTLIGKVSWPVREPITDRHKERLHDAVNWRDIKE